MIYQQTRSQSNLTKHEVLNIINSAKDFKERTMLKCLYYGGMRVSEVVNLRIENIDFQRKSIIIANSKRGKTRKIPFLDAGFLSDLKALIGKRGNGLVFPNPKNKPYTSRNLQYKLAKIAKSAGVSNPYPASKNVNPHLFRHSIARHLKDQGFPMEFIQDFLGHTKLETTTDTYGKLGFEQMQLLAANKIDSQLVGSLNNVIPEVQVRGYLE